MNIHRIRNFIQAHLQSLLLFGLAISLATVSIISFSLRSTKIKPRHFFHVRLESEYKGGDIIEDYPTIMITRNGDFQLPYQPMSPIEFENVVYKIAMLEPIDDRCFLIKPHPDASFQKVVNLLDKLSKISVRVQQDSLVKHGVIGNTITPVFNSNPLPPPPPPPALRPSPIRPRA